MQYVVLIIILVSSFIFFIDAYLFYLSGNLSYALVLFLLFLAIFIAVIFILSTSYEITERYLFVIEGLLIHKIPYNKITKVIPKGGKTKRVDLERWVWGLGRDEDSITIMYHKHLLTGRDIIDDLTIAPAEKNEFFDRLTKKLK